MNYEIAIAENELEEKKKGNDVFVTVIGKTSACEDSRNNKFTFRRRRERHGFRKQLGETHRDLAAVQHVATCVFFDR